MTASFAPIVCGMALLACAGCARIAPHSGQSWTSQTSSRDVYSGTEADIAGLRGKTSYYFKRIETQEELDAMPRADYEVWVQYMKDAGAGIRDPRFPHPNPTRRLPDPGGAAPRRTARNECDYER